MEPIFEKILQHTFPSFIDKKFEWGLPRQFKEYVTTLAPGSVAIDLGANRGQVSKYLIENGCEVHAFEPHPEAYEKMTTDLAGLSNITFLNEAAGTRNRKTKLFLHKKTSEKSKDYSKSSSLMHDKPNVSSELFVEIREIDFAEYLLSLDKPVDLLKIDVEGFEIDLINHLLDKEALQNTAKVFVETHEDKWPELAEPTDKLIQRVRDLGMTDKFDFDWI